ncbi:MAG: hypothetical protein M1832_001552 [Thelocarpon impressellum]|nr:MAG: hypothetical protein M1832_001552 [Thelocarpon impressellum]
MEAVALVSLVAAAASLTKVLASGSESLYSFVQASRVVDSRVESLYKETTALARTLNAITVALSSPRIQSAETAQEEYGELWKTLEESIKACDIIAKQIDGEIRDIRPEKPGFFRNSVSQYKLKLKDENLDRLRAQVHTHGQTLSICLETINLINGIASPDRIIDTLSAKIDDLTVTLKKEGYFDDSVSSSHSTSLLAQGVAVNQRDASGLNALQYACTNCHDETISVLLGRADPNVTNEEGLTPLHSAASRGLEGIVSILLRCSRTNADAVNDRNETPLHMACYGNVPGCVAALLEAGANLNIRNKQGELPLHLASYHGHAECVRLVLANTRAQADEKNAWGETGLHLASSNGHAQTVERLLERADPNAADNEGNTPLHRAAFKGHANVIEQLLSHKADPTIRSDFGQSPLDIAIRKKFESAAAVLREAQREATRTDLSGTENAPTTKQDSDIKAQSLDLQPL